MLAIVNAYDSMVSDLAYRDARSRREAINEIKKVSGTQFDPALAKEFIYLVTHEQVQLDKAVGRRWLRELSGNESGSNELWSAPSRANGDVASHLNNQLFTRLLSSMHDGVIFVDPDSTIVVWNRATEILTDIASNSVLRSRWQPSLIDLRNREGQPPDSCPLARAMVSGVQSLERMTIQGKNGQRLSVHTHVVPLTNPDGSTAGAVLLLHDASHQSDLEERVQTLHEKATRDPLTKVSNRAEFDRMLPSFLETHADMELVCSLVICDIDHFKKINDTYGHQAGDDALIAFASLLRSHSRNGDLVARYGGEEFVILLADCGVETAARRADELRREIAGISQPMLEGASITASFGVAESQPGDTPEAMLRRADRALLQAKENGRNRVIQMGGGGMKDVHIKTDALSRFLGHDASRGNLEARLVSSVPLEVAVAKLRRIHLGSARRSGAHRRNRGHAASGHSTGRRRPPTPLRTRNVLHRRIATQHAEARRPRNRPRATRHAGQRQPSSQTSARSSHPGHRTPIPMAAGRHQVLFHGQRRVMGELRVEC